MSPSRQGEIYRLVGTLRERTERSFEEIRGLMGEYLDIGEYDRSTFYNKFRRRDRNPRYELDEILALISALTTDLPLNVSGCTAYEACQLFSFASMRIEDFPYLKEFFTEDDYAQASTRFLQEQGLINPSRPSTGHLFISYNKTDRDVANRLRLLATHAGHEVWQDTTKIKGGSEWIDAIEEGINRSYAFVVILSASAATSYWVREEILHAQRRNKPIIPLCIDATPLPVGLQQLNCVQAYPDADSGIANLLNTLSAYVNTDIAPALSRRQLEIDYLDRVLLAHGAWQRLYTPMAGERRIVIGQPEPEAVEMTPVILEGLEGFDEFVNETFRETQAQSFPKDILAALDPLHPQCVILGSSGSGKTTTLRHLTAKLADKAKQSESDRLPVLIEAGKVEKDQSLITSIKEQLGPLAAWYDELYAADRMALLLDGINEIPNDNRSTWLEEIREYTRQAVAENRFMVISCRSQDYGQDMDLGIARRFYIKALDPLQVRRFIDTYIQSPVEKRDELFWALAGNEALRFWERFLDEVGDYPDIFWLSQQLPPEMTWGYGGEATQYFYWNQWLEIRSRQNSLLQLARNPYMLSMLTRVFVTQNHVPENRAKLFGTFIEYVLLHREGLSTVEAKGLIRRLAALAFAMQSAESATMTVEAVLQALEDESDVRTAQAANILETGTVVRFTHQLLQHYFAALRLDSLIKTGAAATDYWPADSWWITSGWEETAILLTGLQESDPSPVITWLQDAAPETAARCITESGSRIPDTLRRSLSERWVTRLTERPIAARAAIGRAIGLLGVDPRPGVGLNAEGLPDLDWVEIPTGEFSVSESEKCRIEAFAISRYPITVAQFRAFIDADDGFYNPKWWHGLGQREEAPGVQRFEYSNHPRERVSWYDVVAFCRWLSARLAYEVRLPFEYEWEKVARGPAGLHYPYGNDFEAERGNVEETGIGQTSAVGLFAEGASPYGVLDMSGNVFEWCLNLESSPDKVDFISTERRSLRGGSWAHSAERARADYSYANRPELRRNRIGFRPVRPSKTSEV